MLLKLNIIKSVTLTICEASCLFLGWCLHGWEKFDERICDLHEVCQVSVSLIGYYVEKKNGLSKAFSGFFSLALEKLPKHPGYSRLTPEETKLLKKVTFIGSFPFVPPHLTTFCNPPYTPPPVIEHVPLRCKSFFCKIMPRGRLAGANNMQPLSLWEGEQTETKHWI